MPRGAPRQPFDAGWNPEGVGDASAVVVVVVVGVVGRDMM